MGFDIDICQFMISNGQAKLTRIDDECYLSYNWSDLKEICLEHFSKGECPEESWCFEQHLWNYLDDCQSR
jgi:hypothetical protein